MSLRPMIKQLEADYLVVGSGAMSMAFVDSLVSETDASVVMVDRHEEPGGHWNDAYSFVRLHQSSSHYGVNSVALGEDRIETDGWNRGNYELASGPEVCAYFRQVMNGTFLPSGRVRYFPSCDYRGDGRFTSLVTGAEHRVEFGKVVDGTYMKVRVPATRPPPFEVTSDAPCVPPNAVPELAGQFERFMVIGAGKTGMDTSLHLLEVGVDPDRIGWVMPRDCWLVNRGRIQSGELFGQSLGMTLGQILGVCGQAASLEELFGQLAALGVLLRFDEDVQPTGYRCATVTGDELDQLRRIGNVIRKGHVQRVAPDALELDGGKVTTGPGTLYIDCTADGLPQRPLVPVFEGPLIRLQSLRMCQQVFGAALIGHVEAAYDDDPVKNELCRPVPHPYSLVDFLRGGLADALNEARWAQEPGIMQWRHAARLDAHTPPPSAVPPGPESLQAMQEAAMQAAMAAISNLERLIAENA